MKYQNGHHFGSDRNSSPEVKPRSELGLAFMAGLWFDTRRL